jgi:uncharacterized protein (DUF58 family)
VPPPTYGALLDAVRGVRWPARKPVRAAPAGAHHSRQRGTSAEFTEYRLYRQGEDPRRLDWRLLARSDRAYVRLATDRAVFPTLIALDASGSMDFPEAGEISKWEFARTVAVGLAGVAHSEGDPVGLIVLGGGAPIELEPRTRRGVVAEIARAVDTARAGGAASVPERLLNRRLPPRVVLISDMLSETEKLLGALRGHVASGGEAHAIHIVARAELEPPERTVLAVDPENEAIRRPLSDRTRSDYLAAFDRWRAELAQRCRAAGAAYLMAVSDEPPERTVRRVAGGER